MSFGNGAENIKVSPQGESLGTYGGSYIVSSNGSSCVIVDGKLDVSTLL